jgi:Sec-independent protein translocase protein TatA
VDFGLLLIVLLIAAFVWRGPKTLPQLGRMFGEGVRAVRREVQHDGDEAADDTPGQPESDGH